MQDKIKLYRNEIIKKLIELSSFWDKSSKLKNAIDYSLLNFGKLSRPIIILFGLDELGYNFLDGLDVACALEMIQTYSLIHDDLPEMDNATTRRGKTSNHLVNGQFAALLAGDALLTDSFYVIANSKLNEQQKIELIKLFSLKAGSNGVCCGQVLDVLNEKNTNQTWEDVEKIILNKTSALFEIAFTTIGLIANLEQANIDKLKQIGTLFGLAFQLKDDLNDAFATTLTIGKNINQDDNKLTYHKIYGINKTQIKIENIMLEISCLCKDVFGENNQIFSYLQLLIK